ncbi:MAG: outer membrane protein assembly factor BamA [Candidatus Kapaibacteriales bacterium]
MSNQQRTQPPEYTLLGVTVEGNSYTNSETVIALSGLRVGSKRTYPFDEDVKQGIKTLWKRGQFSSIDIQVDKYTEQGIFLVIKLKEYRRLGRFDIEGNDELEDDELKEEIQLQRGSVLKDYDIFKAKEKIKELYLEEGFQFTQVEHQLGTADSLGFADLTLEVDEGEEFYVGSINFEGNEEFDDDELADQFDDNDIPAWWKVWDSGDFEKGKLADDLKKVIQFYRSEGYIDAAILSDTVIYNDDASVDINVKVFEGKKFYIRSIEFNGNTYFQDDQLMARLIYRGGDVYNVTDFDMNLRGNPELSDASSLYYNTGFLQARFDKQDKRVAEDSVDVVINITEGERSKIRKVEIVGNDKTMDKVIRRELFTKPGDYFNRAAIIKSIRQLGVLNYFNPETLQPQPTPVPGDNTQVDLVYKVEERSTDTFNAQVGFAGNFGLTASIGFTFNNFSITEPFKGGAGQVFNFNYERGGINNFQRFNIGFTEPWLNGHPTTVGFNLFNSSFGFLDFQQDITGGNVNVGRRFRWPDDYWRGNWNFKYQVNDVAGSNSNFFRAGRNTEITIGQTFSRINTNDVFFPSIGSRFSLSTQFAMASIGLGETDFLKNELTFDTYNPLFKYEDKDKIVLYLGARLGYLAGIKSDTAINPIELYRMGGNGLAGIGVTPFRGYQDRTIGPRNGGRLQAKYTAEMRFSITQNPMPIYVYGFAEAGNVWTGFSEVDPFDLRRAAGVGLQLFLNPIGILGFSYGYGFDPTNSDPTRPSGWQFIFNLGQQM